MNSTDNLRSSNHEDRLELVRRCVSAARSDRLGDHGIDGKDGPEEDSPLLGECHRNALVLCEELYEAGFEPILVWGALHFEDPNGNSDWGPPETVSQAEARGAVHFWVELDWADQTLIVDIGAEIPTQFGEPYVDFELPSCYIRPEKCRFIYEPGRGITTTQLRNKEGYQFLREEGLGLDS